MSKKKKTRVDLRKNRSKPPRDQTWTGGLQEHGFEEEAPRTEERVRAKGDLSRRRTIMQEEPAHQTAQGVQPAEAMPAADTSECQRGRVLKVHGLLSHVEAQDGTIYRC